MGRVNDKIITLSHGGGGRAMHNLIDDVFRNTFNNSLLDTGEDQARITLQELSLLGDRLAFTTDSYVVDPLFFPGGDIGTLAVNGTINDLAVSGATPQFLSCAVIIEEGFEVDTLRRVANSMQQAATAASVQIVTGDTKVVPRGAADKLFINTAGLGVIASGVQINSTRAQPSDVIVINGYIGDHGAAILNARGDLALKANIESDCQALHDLIQSMLRVCPDIHCLRDATRGGVATVLNEIAEQSKIGIRINESALPIHEEVKGVCEILGLDPLYFANEGKVVAIIPADAADKVLAEMRAHEKGKYAAIIGEITSAPKEVVILNTGFGGERIVDTLVGEQLPRIC